MVSERYLARLARAADEAQEAGLAAILVTPSPDLVYLTGYDPPPLERLTLLALVPGRDPVLLAPELERARALHSPVGDRLEVETWSDGQDPYAAAARLLPAGDAYAATDRMWAAHLMGLQGALPDAAFVPASPVLSRLRAAKDDHELELLSRAARGADESFRRIVQLRLEGQREEEVARCLSELLVEHGHDRAELTIVASGPNGASPHHKPGGRTLRPGDPVVMDFGGALAGYFSDTTRTVCLGEPPPGFLEVYELVREAQEEAFRAVAPGVPAREVDRAARDVIERGGYGDRFIHRTGHGIGLEVHEPPYIVEGNEDPLLPGMCFSIEPGIYLEGQFGVRIEDIVTVTAEGGARLNRTSRALCRL